MLLNTLIYEIFVSRNVIFYENVFPYNNIEGLFSHHENCVKDHDFNFLLKPIKYNTDNKVQIGEIKTNHMMLIRTITAIIDLCIIKQQNCNADNSNDVSIIIEINQHDNGNADYLRYSNRTIKLPNFLNDYLKGKIRYLISYSIGRCYGKGDVVREHQTLTKCDTSIKQVLKQQPFDQGNRGESRY